MICTKAPCRISLVALSLLAGNVSAATVVWLGSGSDDFWGNPANWIGGVRPRDGDDVVFGASPSFQAIVDYSVSLASFTFTTPATLTEIHVGAGLPSTLTFAGAGIVDNTTSAAGPGAQYFYADASSGPTGGTLLFTNTASVTGAATTTLRASGASVAGGGGGNIVFRDGANAGQATIYNDNATNSGAGTTGGRTLFYDNASAAAADILALGGKSAGAAGGRIEFHDNATAGAASLVAATGFSGGQGGRIVFLDDADGGTAYIGLDGDGTAGAANGTLDISGSKRASVSIGRLDGTAGLVNLGDRNLAIVGGQAGITAYFGGILQGAGGSLTIASPGFVTLGGASTYTGNTLVSSGALLLGYGSLATPLVSVSSGATFGGNGTVAGRVDLAAGATLAPSAMSNGGQVLDLGALSSVAGANFNFKLGAPGLGPTSDLVNVSGNLALAGTLNVADSGGFGFGAYRLINYGGTLTGAGLTLGMFPGGYAGSDFAIQSGSGQVNLIVGGTNVLFWDGPHTLGNGVVDGGTSTWNNATTNWTYAGGVANVAWGSRFSVFSGAAGTVTVTEPVASSGMQFSTSGYVVNAIPGASVVLPGAATVRVDPGVSATLDAPLTGAGSLTKLDTGTLTLGGSNTYAGGTTVADGRLIVTNAAGQGLGTGPVNVSATASAELDFVGNASAGSVSITSVGAPSTAVSAFVGFNDNATAGFATIVNQGNTANGGFGGQLNFADASSAGHAVITNAGSAYAPPVGTFAVNGAGTTLFLNNSTAGSATFLNTAGLAPGTLGGRVFFTDTSTAGASTITNQGAFAFGNGGLAEFSGNATAGTTTFFNQAATIALSNGGTVNFRDNSSAGSAVFTQSGSGVASAMSSSAGGAVTFYNASNAANGTFYNQGAAAANTYGGATFFRDTSTAGTAVITNGNGSANSGIGGGRLVFSDNSTAGSATITAAGGSAAAPDGGDVNFYASATAGAATLTAGGGTGGGGAGLLSFSQSASGGIARVVLDGGTLDLTGLTTPRTTVGSLEGDGGKVFLGNKGLTVGGNNLGTVFGGSISGSGSLTKSGTGSLTLTGASTYSGGTVIANGAIVVTNSSGLALGTGLVTNNPANPATTIGLSFTGNGSAGSVAISNLGSLNSLLFAETAFNGNSTAGASIITVQASPGDFGIGGRLVFGDAATAGSATIINAGTSYSAGLGAYSNLGGYTFFYGTSTAGTAKITNQASSGKSVSVGQTFFGDAATAGSSTIINAGSAVTTGDAYTGGDTMFNGYASAATSTITNRGGQTAGLFGGTTFFHGNSTAGSSTIFNEGGTASGALGGSTDFIENSTAGNATLFAESAPGGGAGGMVTFSGNSTGGTARAILQGGGSLTSSGGLDISDLGASGMTIGSIEGGGVVTLGSKNLQVAGNGLHTTFSGLIKDGTAGFSGGHLTIAGNGAYLQLTGANTYTGGTSIGDGLTPNSGKLIAANTTGSATGSGPVVVNRGGTLSGSGRIAGPVTLRAGGTIAPGDPVTLTFEDSLTWDGGGVIQLVLGATQADSDFLSILGHLIRGTDGEFRFDLIDAGYVAGQQYRLIGAGALDGFSASDFTVSGIAGNFLFVYGALEFSGVATPVPEPGTVWLVLGGLLVLVSASGRRRPLSLSRQLPIDRVS